MDEVAACYPSYEYSKESSQPSLSEPRYPDAPPCNGAPRPRVCSWVCHSNGVRGWDDLCFCGSTSCPPKGGLGGLDAFISRTESLPCWRGTFTNPGLPDQDMRSGTIWIVSISQHYFCGQGKSRLALLSELAMGKCSTLPPLSWAENEDQIEDGAGIAKNGPCSLMGLRS